MTAFVFCPAVSARNALPNQCPVISTNITNCFHFICPSSHILLAKPSSRSVFATRKVHVYPLVHQTLFPDGVKR